MSARNYILTTPKDVNGQPLQLFRCNLENNVSKAIDQLTGICLGILADGVVVDSEALFFAEWVKKHSVLEPVWPFTEVLKRLDRIFTDGHCSDDERKELKGLMESICGPCASKEPIESFSSALPLDCPLPEPIVFSSRRFSITGRFAYGTRRKVFEAIETMGGSASDSPPNRDSHYLVIGLFASRDWITTSYGRKIERAVELRAAGTGISIISEEHWKKFLSPFPSIALRTSSSANEVRAS